MTGALIPIEKTCIICGKVWMSQRGGALACSTKCSQRHYKAKKRLEKANAEKAFLKISDKILASRIKYRSHKDIASDLYNKPYLTVLELCAIMSVSRDTVYKLIRDKAFPTTRFGKKIIVYRTELDKYLKTQEIKT